MFTFSYNRVYSNSFFFSINYSSNIFEVYYVSDTFQGTEDMMVITQ